jgi:hypothetical protein
MTVVSKEIALLQLIDAVAEKHFDFTGSPKDRIPRKDVINVFADELRLVMNRELMKMIREVMACHNVFSKKYDGYHYYRGLSKK